MTTLASMTVRLGIDTDQLQRGADAAKKTLMGLGKAAGVLGVGIPAAAGVAVAVGGIAAAAASAGAAVGAFKLAAGPQMAAVASVADLAAQAQEAAADGGKKATDAQKAYNDALAKLPAATQTTAKAFVGLKSDFKTWSDSLASSTMPVFTKGIGALRDALPSLTPFVKDASKTLGSFADQLKKGVNSDGFKRFMADLQASARTVLPALLNLFKNLGKGIAKIFQAFLPIGAQLMTKISQVSGKFADFGSGLSTNPAFAKFVELGKTGGSTLGNLAAAVAQLYTDLSPVVGITTKFVLLMAQLAEKIPVGVLTRLGEVLLVVKASMVAYQIVTKTVELATKAWSAAQAIFNAIMALSPVTLIVLAIIALIAVIVLIATKTTWFQTAWSATWGFIKAVGLAIWNWMKSVFTATLDFIKGVWNTSLNWIKSVWNTAWTWVKTKAELIWAVIKLVVQSGVDRVKSIINGIQSIIGKVTGFFQRMKDGAVDKVAALISYVKGIPGKIKSAIGSLGNLLKDAGRHIIQGLIDGVSAMIGSLKNKFNSITGMIPDWKGPMDVDARLLTPNGEAIMGGLMTGVDNALPSLRRQLGDVTSMIPSNVNVGVNAAGAAGKDGTQHLVLELAGAPEFKALIRGIVRKDGRGDVQTAFGTR